MARPPDLEKRAELAAAAFDYLRAQGVRRVTMSELARAPSTKRSTLYWYFPDLGSIFETALEGLFEDQDSFVAERLVGIAHPIDLIYAYIQAVHAFYAGREEHIVFMFQFWAVGSPDEPARALERIRARYLPRRAQAIAMIEAGIEAGQVHPCDAEALIGLIGATIDGLLIQRQITNAALAPIYDIIWTRLLEPLKRDAKKATPSC